MSAFVNAIRAENLKVFTTKMWWILAIIVVVYIGPTAAGMGLIFGMSSAEGDMELMLFGSNLHLMIYAVATSVGYVFPLLYGSMSATGELRHQTITPTFLATPRRGISLGAKSLVQAGVGAGYGVLAFAVTIAGGALTLMVNDVSPGLADADTWFLVLRGVCAMALWGVIGVGVGALLRNQVAAIVVVLAFTQFLEPILRSLSLLNSTLETIGMYLPGAASDAFVGASLFSVAGLMGGATLTWWQGGLVLAGYAAVFSGLGYLVSWRRDIT